MKPSVPLLIVLAYAGIPCPKGCITWEGACACEAKTAVNPPDPIDPKNLPSSEQVPDDKMPSYQREYIHADMPDSLISQDRKLDEERDKADAEGKKAAGIK